MKTILFIAILVSSISVSFAQTPPKIKVPGSTALPQGSFKTNTSFSKSKRYYSQDNRYCFVFQEDGNLVVYKFSTPKKYKAIWNTNTNGLAIKKCIFQGDGNLVMYNYEGKAVWNAYSVIMAKKQKEAKGLIVDADVFYPLPGADSWLTMQNDGNLVIYYGKYPKADSQFWNTGSFEKN